MIVGGGVSGYAAALEARKRGLDFELIDRRKRLDPASGPRSRCQQTMHDIGKRRQPGDEIMLLRDKSDAGTQTPQVTGSQLAQIASEDRNRAGCGRDKAQQAL